MTIVGIIICIIIGLIGICGSMLCCGAADTRFRKIVSIVLVPAAAMASIAGVWWYSYHTESGKRAYKDQQSNINGGIYREVKVYDIEGDLMAEYSGKFDVETTPEYVLFDDENGNRHIIYYTTGTIIIDELEGQETLGD